MAKRFTDSEKWKDAWFMDLPIKYKLFWIYILDDCNNGGIWKVNFKVASFFIGEHLEYSEVMRIFKERVYVISNEYWFIEGFIKYQYKCNAKELNPKNKAHLSVIRLLDEFKIEKIKPLESPLLGTKDKDKDKEMDKEMEVYTKTEFLQDWNKLRTKHLKKPSFLNSITFDDDNLLNNLSKDNNRDDFTSAMVGLFKQKKMPNDNTTMQSNPSHFLKFFNSYLTAFHDANDMLYGKKDI